MIFGFNNLKEKEEKRKEEKREYLKNGSPPIIPSFHFHILYELHYYPPAKKRKKEKKGGISFSGL